VDDDLQQSGPELSGLARFGQAIPPASPMSALRQKQTFRCPVSPMLGLPAIAHQTGWENLSASLKLSPLPVLQTRF